MGKLKKALEAEPLQTEESFIGEPDVHPLTDEEFNYLINANQVKINTDQELNRLIAAFLHDVVAVSRLNYNKDSMLKFELDFDDREKKLKIWKQPEMKYTTEHQTEDSVSD